MTEKKICVLGAGIIGLSTAVALQERFPTYKITIIADAFSPNLTSDVAAGLIEPYLCNDNEAKIIHWCSTTMRYIRDYMREHPNGGAQEMSGYLFHREKQPVPFWADCMPNFRILTEHEVKERHSEPQAAGYFYTTLYLEPTKHLEFLQRKFHHKGGRMVPMRVESLDDIGSDWDLVVNCTGLGSRQLFNDHSLRPIRGQVMRVKAPAVKHFYVDNSNYVLLNDDCLILGGTADKDQWDTTINETTAREILQGCQKLVPALKSCKVLSHHVGLRPARPEVRVESDTVKINGSLIPLVHNYGHGGSGVTLFWGCALDVVSLVDSQLNCQQLAKL